MHQPLTNLANTLVVHFLQKDPNNSYNFQNFNIIVQQTVLILAIVQNLVQSCHYLFTITDAKLKQKNKINQNNHKIDTFLPQPYVAHNFQTK